MSHLKRNSEWYFFPAESISSLIEGSNGSYIQSVDYVTVNPSSGVLEATDDSSDMQQGVGGTSGCLQEQTSLEDSEAEEELVVYMDDDEIAKEDDIPVSYQNALVLNEVSSIMHPVILTHDMHLERQPAIRSMKESNRPWWW